MSRQTTMTRRPADARAQGATPAGRQGRRARRAARPGRVRRAPGRALLLWGALVGALALGLAFLFYFSTAFVVEDVTVTGGREEVRAEAERLADIPEGRPLARVSETRISERVLTDPRIAGLAVSRDWPSGVQLRITEREPVVALRGGDETWLADAQGRVFEQVEKPSRRLPVISVQETPPAELAPATVSGLADLWRQRPDPADLEGKLGAPRVASDGTVTMTLDQVTLRWGEPVENTKKWQVVQALIGQDAIDPQGAEPLRIDVRNPDAPVVTGLPEKTD